MIFEGGNMSIRVFSNNSKIISYFFVLVLFSSAFSGCFSKEEILPEQFGVPGGLVLACLNSSEFTELVIEVDYEADQKPRPETLELLVERISSVCQKQSVTFDLFLTDFEHEGSWTNEEIRTIGRDTRENNAMNNAQLRFHFLFPSGMHSDENVLGVTVDASTVMIFVDRIKESENIIQRPSWENIEAAVAVHELGHLLGLVNIVYTSNVDHEDSEHPGHSSNEDSVMYWAIESSDFFNIFTGTLPNDFDADDKGDLSKLSSAQIQAINQLWYPDGYSY
jgi:hypothetical protein